MTAHELESIWVLIHPPLAILGYLFTFIALTKAVQLNRKIYSGDRAMEKDLRLSLVIAWWLTFLGLISGMLWAQMAWGSFWSWDPKETATLSVFLVLTAAAILNQLKCPVPIQTAVLILDTLLVLFTFFISFLDLGLHSF